MDLEQKDLRKWYAVQTRSNMEQKAVDALKRTIDIEDMGEYINKDDILMPTELVSEVKNNKKTTRKRKLYPGYIFVKVKLYDEDENFLEKPWYMIRAVNGVINFMGGDRPTPLKKAEIDRIFQQTVQNLFPAETAGSHRFRDETGLLQEHQLCRGNRKIWLRFHRQPRQQDLKCAAGSGDFKHGFRMFQQKCRIGAHPEIIFNPESNGVERCD